MHIDFQLALHFTASNRWQQTKFLKDAYYTHVLVNARQCTVLNDLL